MPLDDRATRVSERCAAHPGRPAVEVCEACGRPLCVACAVPVRGRVVGVECIGSMLGELPQPVPGRGWSRLELTGGISLALVVIASALPWTRFGVGSAFLGGWDAVPSWSLLASASGVVTFPVWWMIGRRGGRAEVVASAGGVVAAVAAFLALINPPPFTKPWIGTMTALLGGLAAAVAGALETRRQRRVG